MKILIADDEVIIRTGLAKVIKWEELGLLLLEPASSAEEVLERLMKEKPDILLTDIRMSGKTGLELAEEAKVLLPDLEVIILSGYDDFIFTQQAIRQNVSDYLLKTSKPEEIIKTVLKVKQRVEEKRKARSRDNRIRSEERHKRLIRWIIDGDGEALDSDPVVMNRLNAGFSNGNTSDLWQVILLTSSGWGHSQGEETLLRFAVNNAIQDLLPCISFIHDHRVVLVVRCSLEKIDASLRRSTFDRIEVLLKCKLTIVGGARVEKPVQLQSSYLTALEAIGYQSFFKSNSWEYADIQFRKGGKRVCSYEEERKLSQILLEDDPLALKVWVQRYIEDLLIDPEATPDTLEAALQSVALAAFRWLDRVLSSIGKENAAEQMLEPLRLKADITPNDALFQHLHAMMKLYHHKLSEGKTSHVHRAIIFIEEKIGLDLGLQQVADHVHLHPNHLSELFKKETGMKFVDYVASKKMQRAMEILSSSPGKISDVALKVGYEDVKYFGQIFKKHTGRTPSDFREESISKKGQELKG